MGLYSGFPEEDFMAVYRYARAIDALDQRLTELARNSPTAAQEVRNLHPEWNWKEAFILYLQAYNMRPGRAEPLYFIGKHYRDQDQHTIAFNFLRRAVEIPYPKDDLLFIEKHMYDFDRYDQLSQSASWIGECAIGKRAIDYLAHNYPDASSHIETNRQWYDTNCAGKYGNFDYWGCGTCPE